ncbi:YjbH domain-containing protein [Zunongwangia sp. F363]|uniref:YjbH domain-containing protein n=1 Tax=Autumnicola tepida TaxID=3075595 RepID=A0ABU3C7H0_9FLAO|nr:YjbH domain-containing protein [Zunongwangia sp. F363]MDT0642291.1 YjbH domain-containing protein [Zunongwangia sp. F363]
MRLKIILFLSIIYFPKDVTSQVNIMGKSGYINTPSAEWFEDKPLGFSYALMPGNYSVFGNEFTDVQFYNARASITSFFEVNLSIAHRPARAKINKLGIGDRQLDFGFRLLKEKKYWPAIVLGWTPPGSAAPYLAHDYLALTKNFKTGFGDFSLTTGYGSPYVFLKKNDSNSFLDFHIEKKTETRLNANYLTGVFAGFSYQPVQWGGAMAEYDSNTLNAGVFIQPWDWLNLQGYTYEGKEWAFSAALNFSLDFLPKTLRSYEKFRY